MKVEIEEGVLMQLAYEHAELATSSLRSDIVKNTARWLDKIDDPQIENLLGMLIKAEEEKKDAIYKRYGITRQREGKIKEKEDGL